MSAADQRRLETRLRAARGEEPAELVLAGGKVVNLFDGRVEETSVAVSGGVVVGLGDYQGREVVDLAGAYLAPGLIDGHLHVESSLLTPARLAQAAAPRGTAAIVADPHEIANVLGLAGIRAMLDNSRNLPVSFYFMAPSCVPATGLETAGASLGAAELTRAGRWRRVLGLGEMMNFPGAVNGDPAVLAKLAAFGRRPVDGHAPRLSGRELNAYLAAGPASDHECTTAAEAAEKLARGMWVLIRQGTAARNLDDLLAVVNPLTERRCCLVCDDLHPDGLVDEGHLDALLRRAVAGGLDPVTALRMVTLNPARRFGLARRGAVAPGWAADLVVLEDLREFRALAVYHAGRLVAREGSPVEASAPAFPDAGRDTVHLPPLDGSSFAVEAAGPRARVIGLVPGQVLTRHLVEETPSRRGRLAADPERDLARLNVIERHGKGGGLGHGLVRGLGLARGAIAGSVAHDSHNLVVAAADVASALTAVRRLAELGGGLVAAAGERVLAELPLPVAGLMCEREAGEVARDLRRLNRGAAELCSLPEPFMALSFLCLPVIPALKLTDRGLVDVERFRPVGLFVD
jgi:adenine deaminase